MTTFVFAWATICPGVARARQAAPATTAAPAEDPVLAGARQHFEAGRNAYNAGDYPTAIKEFKAAEALRPSPILAYNIGLANEKLQRRRVAVRYYKRYLEGAPSATNRAEVEGRIAALEKEIAAQPQAQPVEQPQDNPPPPPPPPSQDPNASPTVQQGSSDPYGGPAPMTTAPVRKKRNLWWVWLLVGVGSAAVVAGIVVGVYYATRSDTYYYYGNTIDGDRLHQAPRRDVVELGRGAALPGERRLADTSPVLELRF